MLNLQFNKKEMKLLYYVICNDWNNPIDWKYANRWQYFWQEKVDGWKRNLVILNIPKNYSTFFWNKSRYVIFSKKKSLLKQLLSCCIKENHGKSGFDGTNWDIAVIKKISHYVEKSISWTVVRTCIVFLVFQ